MSSHPAVDLRTNRVAVVMQDRPVVPLTNWIADVIRVCAENNKGLQLVTPHTSRLTTALDGALSGPDTRWVVNGPGGHYDGRTGRPLAWNGEAFTPMNPLALGPAYTSGPPAPAWHHTIALQIRHQATAELRVGGALEQLATTVTGHPPTGWGVAEPVAQPWDIDQYTDLCRQRAPRRTWLCAVGDSMLATTVVSRTAGHVLETIRCTVTGPDPLPAAVFADPMREIATAYDIRHALIQQCPGEADPTRAPQWTGLSTPLAMLVGVEATAGRESSELLSIGEVTHTRIEDSLWYELATEAEDPAVPWTRLESVMSHLTVPWLTTEAARERRTPDQPIH